MPKLFIDCTATFFSNLNTGIQRTTRKIIENSKCFDTSVFDAVCPVIQFSNTYYILSDQEVNARLTSFLHISGAKIRNILDEILIKKNVDRSGEHDPCAPNETYNNIIKTGRYFLDIFFKITRHIDSFFLKVKKVDFEKDDILFIPDSFWDPLFTSKTLIGVRKNQCKIVLFIHDVFPITHPDLVSRSSSELFAKKIELILPLIDGFICNSKFTLSEMRSYLAETKTQYFSLPAAYVHLGADVMGSVKRITSELSAVEHRHYYLMVGTIEPKKNHNYVLNTFESLWNAGYTLPLVIVGRIGWKCNETIEKIRSSKYFNKYLFMYNDASDEQLILFYQKTRAVIMASFVEGYGLPVVEAMQYGCTVFASDIPIFREIGQDYPFYFDIQHEMSLVDLVQEFERKGNPDAKRYLPHIQTWEECVKQLSEVLCSYVSSK